MKRFVRTLVFAAAATLPLVWLPACEPVSPEAFFASSRKAEMVVESHFALSLEPSTGRPGTKMSDAVIQEEAGNDPTAFRGIEQIYVIPFNTYAAITASDTRYGRNLQLPQLGITPTWGAAANAGLVSNNNSHLYEGVVMKSGTASVLVYGRAIDENVSTTPADSVEFKHRNGVLRQHGLEDAASPSDMWFELDPLVDASAEASMNASIQAVLTYLTSVAGASVSFTGYANRRTTTQTTWTYTWDTPTQYNNYQTLVSAFETLTGNGLAFSGSTDAVAGMLTSIYNGLYDLANSTNNSNSYRQGHYTRNSWSTTPDDYYYYVYELSREIRDLIDNSTYVTVTGSGNNATVAFKSPYAGIPASYGVPEGAVAVQWNGTSFVQVTAANSALAPISSYCYPPSLWYWTDSRLKTSADPSVTGEYVSSNPTWTSILDNYTYGSTVLPGVAAAAVTEPLQYGVAQLRLSLGYAVSEGGTANLLDSRAETVNVSNSNFPLTGVLISEQRHQAFNFTPRAGDNYCIFDSDVNEGSTPKAYIASAASGLTLKPVNTLVVQTENGQDIHYALEFSNNSDSPFYGAGGCAVNPGSKFYLVGILKLSEATNNTGETINSVFLQDHVTEAHISVKGLASAYNTIPELRDPQLQIGVQTEMKWVGSTPAQIPMY